MECKSENKISAHVCGRLNRPLGFVRYPTENFVSYLRILSQWIIAGKNRQDRHARIAVAAYYRIQFQFAFPGIIIGSVAGCVPIRARLAYIAWSDQFINRL